MDIKSFGYPSLIHKLYSNFFFLNYNEIFTLKNSKAARIFIQML